MENYDLTNNLAGDQIQTRQLTDEPIYRRCALTHTRQYSKIRTKLTTATMKANWQTEATEELGLSAQQTELEPQAQTQAEREEEEEREREEELEREESTAQMSFPASEAESRSGEERPLPRDLCRLLVVPAQACAFQHFSSIQKLGHQAILMAGTRKSCENLEASHQKSLGSGRIGRHLEWMRETLAL